MRLDTCEDDQIMCGIRTTHGEKIIVRPHDDPLAVVVDSLPTGTYMVGVLHPIIDRIGLETMALAVRIAEPGNVVLPLALPSAATVIATRCKDAGSDLPPGAVTGVVRRANSRLTQLIARAVREIHRH